MKYKRKEWEKKTFEVITIVTSLRKISK